MDYEYGGLVPMTHQWYTRSVSPGTSERAPWRAWRPAGAPL